MGHALLHQRGLHMIAQARAHGLGHGHMRDQAGAEKTLVAREGAVDELIDHHKGARRQIGAQAADGRQRQHIGGADDLQRGDVGAVVHFRWWDAVAAAMARQKGQFRAAVFMQQPATKDLVRR